MGIDPFFGLSLRIPNSAGYLGSFSLAFAQKCSQSAGDSPWGTKMHEIIGSWRSFTEMICRYVTRLLVDKPFGKEIALPIPKLLRWRHHDAPWVWQRRIRSLGEGNQVLERACFT
jgi:hypothetical protein